MDIATRERKETVESQITGILASYEGTKGDLVPILQQVQQKCGYLPETALKQIAKFINVPESTVFGVATFYAQFRFTPPGDHSIKVCFGTACYVRGIERVLAKLNEKLKIDVGETTEATKFSIDIIRCLGCCAIAPVIMIDEEVHSALTPKKAISVLSKYAPISIEEATKEK